MRRMGQMLTPQGNEAKDQFLIWHSDDLLEFQSYGSTIAMKTPKGIVLDEYYWDYSSTTGKYRNQFLGEKKAETLKKIRSGEYKLKNLNK